MDSQPPEGVEERLTQARNLWLTTLRADGSPHVTPIWFVWHGGRFWMCTSSGNVKVRNLRTDPRVALALEDGNRPVVAEGRAVLHARPYPAAVAAGFMARYDWDVTATDDLDGDYAVLVEVAPARWLLAVP